MAQRGPLTLYLIPQFTARGKLFFYKYKMYNYIAPCIPNLAISCILCCVLYVLIIHNSYYT